MTRHEQEALQAVTQAMTQAGRALMALCPEFARIKLTFENVKGELLTHHCIYSAERQRELDQTEERRRRKAESELRRASR